MTQKEFIHLHVHSEFSLLDGACRIKPLMKRLHELKMPAVALTDHGNMFGAINFFKEAKESGIKPIVGCELYVTGGSRHDRGSGPGGERRSANHLLLLAKDYEGYLNIAKLSSLGYIEGFYGRPRVDHEILAKHSKGIIATSGCLKGEIPEALVEGREHDAASLLDTYLQIFGRENFYFEIQDHGLTEQRTLIDYLRVMTKKYHVPLLASNDCHYLKREDAALHDVLLCIQTGKTMQDQKRFKFTGDAFYLKTAEEMHAVFPEFPEACVETLAVAEKCNVEIPLKQKLLPKFDCPEGHTEDTYLAKVANDGLRARFPAPHPDYQARLDFELKVMQSMGFSSYFLIVWDFVHFAQTNGISVGPGRGSAAGSLVAYALRITDIDPIEHGLLFERFLNPERVSMPDIDIDFCFENRGRVIDYVKRKYGDTQVAQIITFGTLKPKNAIRDIGRAMNVDLETVNSIAKLIPTMLKPEKGQSGMDYAFQEEPALKEVYENNPTARTILDYARQIEGMARHASTHAAGIVITDRNIMDLVPVYQQAGTTDIATQYTMSTVEEIGLLKMDFLGLKNLTIIENCLRSMARNYNVSINWDEISLSDPKTYEILRKGRTFGVFQLESQGMTKLVVNMGPTCFADLTALLALYRPGPLGAKMDLEYVECKHGRKEPEYDHPMLEPILKETHGVILYQEQVMQAARTLAGFSLGDADQMRRAMGKKKADEMAKQRQNFVTGCARNDIDDILANKIFDKIDYFSGYGFNKSHSAAYAVLTFRTAYLKAHYPVDYMAALMTNAIGDKVESMSEYFAEARALKIRVLPPDVNESLAQFAVVDGNIRFGLAAIKNVGEAAVDAMVTEREQNGPYRTFEEFCRRNGGSVLNSRLVESLIKAGAFDNLGHHRSQLLDAMEPILELASARHKEADQGQASLFDAMDSSASDDDGAVDSTSLGTEFPLRNLPEVPERERLQWEKELIGFFVSGHPLDPYVTDMQSFATCNIPGVQKLHDGDYVSIVGIISKITTRTDRNGGTIGFVDVTDLDGTTEVLVFNRTFQAVRSAIVLDEVVFVRGKVKPDSRAAASGDGPVPNKIMADDIVPIEVVRQKRTKVVELEMSFDAAANGHLEKVAELLRAHKGRKAVRLSVRNERGNRLQVDLGKEFNVVPSNELIKKVLRLPGVLGLKFQQQQDDDSSGYD